MPGPVERTSSTGTPATVSTAQAAHEQQSFSTATSLRSSSSTPAASAGWVTLDRLGAVRPHPASDRVEDAVATFTRRGRYP